MQHHKRKIWSLHSLWFLIPTLTLWLAGTVEEWYNVILHFNPRLVASGPGPVQVWTWPLGNIPFTYSFYRMNGCIIFILHSRLRIWVALIFEDEFSTEYSPTRAT